MKETNSNNYKRLKLFKSLIGILIVVIILLSILFFPKSIPFWPFNVSDIVVLLVSLFLISLFIERTVEVIIIVFREKDKQELINDLNSERKKAEQSAKEVPKDKPAHEDEAARKLNNYNAETKTLAIPIAFTLGIVISALGIRVLQPLIDPAIFKTLSTLQKALFTGADTLVTGALLGGGSKGIHEIMEAFLNTVEKYRSYIKTEKK